MSQATVASSVPHPGTLNVMMQLMKLRVIVLLQITALCAILVHDSLARHGLLDVERTWEQTLWVSLITVVGGTLSAGGSNAINMWYDADIDPHMRRTMNRPVPLGHATPQFALLFGSTIAVLGCSLFLLVSAKAAFWSAFSVLFYVLVYSMWLKRRTPQNIVIGGLAGSTPKCSPHSQGHTFSSAPESTVISVSSPPTKFTFIKYLFIIGDGIFKRITLLTID